MIVKIEDTSNRTHFINIELIVTYVKDGTHYIVEMYEIQTDRVIYSFKALSLTIYENGTMIDHKDIRDEH